MKTQCPNPTCKHPFEVPDDRSGKNGACPSCGQVITYRSIEIQRKIEEERTRQQQAGHAFQDSNTNATHNNFVVLLEDIRSLWNVGAIFRSADGAGISRLILCGITGCPPRKEIAKTSLGAEDSVHWEYAAHALEVLPKLKEAGTQIIALEKTEQSTPLSTCIKEKKLHAPLCLVIGNEVSGVSPEALSLCDQSCHLPMRGIKTSLNVAVAFGIGAYQIAECIYPENLS